MVDISDKPVSERTAVAEGSIRMSAECYEKVKNGGHRKGDVLQTARIAGIMGAKRTSELIPLCHNIALSSVKIDFDLRDDENAVGVICTVSCEGRTGAEMEALTGVNVALLTVYDMCKAVDKAMIMSDIRLVSKTGGKSGEYRAGSRT